MADRYVTKHPKGWAVKAPGGERASSVHGTQREAETAAKRTVHNLGGGEVRIQGRDGRWRYQVGGAITTDSDPGEEYQETLDKTRALLTTLTAARECGLVLGCE